MKDHDIHLSRRALLKTSAIAGATSLTLLSAPSILRAAAPMRLTFGHGAAPGNPRTIAADKFAELVKEKSGGAIEVMVAGSEQLGSDPAMITALRTGALDMTANSQGPAAAVVPELAALGLPFLFEDGATAIRILNEKLQDGLTPKFEKVGVLPVGWWDNGIRHMTNGKRPLVQPGDLKGLKFRTPADPSTIALFEALGAATAQIAWSEVYVALQQGVVDGQENPLTNISSAKIYEVNPYVSLSAHKWESTPVLMSKMAWGRLDDNAREVVRGAMAEATALQISLSAEKAEELLAEFEANPAIKVNEVDRDAFRKKTASVIDSWQKEKSFGDFVKQLREAVGA
ncbi:TRAP dicarboxylate transporter, DctP subunit [uncultured Pleomorphomonas sp.]|uniref:TRAP dicarboxylate transporter, DctP subunit n=1 Tax=uncultured Pleomorphomonas sp. TaxID=442121 RepID=A0A212LG71_9HYPH|nr:TRAP transporter substrate-binding protein [uncultured Pleomorphomonas sp.]SCM76545.1 TRAP dicarboxylate transporter, DctP subunit [uncultured Pleomorphomonas sp.]